MKKTLYVLLLLVILVLFTTTANVFAKHNFPSAVPTPPPYDPNLPEVIKSCPGYCVYSKDNFTLPLHYAPGTQLPQNGSILWNYIFEKEEIVSILSHVESDGQKFLNLKLDTLVYFIYPDGAVYLYKITSIDTWMDTNRWKTFVSLDGTKSMKGYQLFDRYYAHSDNYDRLVFQTCTPDNKGVIFIIGQKISP